jgi:hypothetical protein
VPWLKKYSNFYHAVSFVGEYIWNFYHLVFLLPDIDRIMEGVSMWATPLSALKSILIWGGDCFCLNPVVSIIICFVLFHLCSFFVSGLAAHVYLTINEYGA